jgi:hypothetical protein
LIRRNYAMQTTTHICEGQRKIILENNLMSGSASCIRKFNLKSYKVTRVVENIGDKCFIYM